MFTAAAKNSLINKKNPINYIFHTDTFDLCIVLNDFQPFLQTLNWEQRSEKLTLQTLLC